MSKHRQPDDADMPPRVVDVQQPFVRIRVWHEAGAACAYLGISEPEHDTVVCVAPDLIDHLVLAWAEYRAGGAASQQSERHEPRPRRQKRKGEVSDE